MLCLKWTLLVVTLVLCQVFAPLCSCFCFSGEGKLGLFWPVRSHMLLIIWRSASPCQNCSFPVGVLCFWFYMLWVLFAVLQCVMFAYVLLALWLSWLFTSKLVPSLFSPFATLLSENVISSFALLNHRLSC